MEKVCLDLLKESGKIGPKPCNTSVVPNTHLMNEYGDFIKYPKRFRKLVGKLN